MIIRNIFLVLLALLQSYFLILEMFLWSTPKGLKTFNMSMEHAKIQAVLAANQGLYNGFLAAGLIWAVFISGSEFSRDVAIFFSSCVLIAGLYGAYSANRKILYVQGASGIDCVGIELNILI